MANGFISGLAGMRAAQGAGSQMGFFNLGSTAMKDLRKLERLEDEYKEEKRLREQEARDRDKKRGKGRVGGGLLGAALITALTGGAATPLMLAAGAGLGSYAGQRTSQGGVSLRTPLGRKSTLRKIARGTDDTFFHSGAKRKLEGYRKDLNDFLKEADSRFDQTITASAMSDAFTAYKLAGLDWKEAGRKLKNIKHLPSVMKGEMSWDNYKGLMESPLPTGLPTPDKTAIKSSVEGAKLSGEQLLEKISDPTAINYEKSGEFLKRYGREGEKIFKNMSTAGRKTGIPEAMELKKQKDLKELIEWAGKLKDFKPMGIKKLQTLLPDSLNYPDWFLPNRLGTQSNIIKPIYDQMGNRIN